MAPVTCTEDGACSFDKSESHLSSGEWDQESALGSMSTGTEAGGDESRKSSAQSSASSRSTQNLVDASLETSEEAISRNKIPKKQESKVSLIKRKMASIRRKHSDQTVRKFRSVFSGLQSNTNYNIHVSFMIAGRKLSSETYVVLGQEERILESSNKSTTDGDLSSLQTINFTNSTKFEKQQGHPEQLLAIEENGVRLPASYNVSSDEGGAEKPCQDIMNGTNQQIVIAFKAKWCSLCRKVENDLMASADFFASLGLILIQVDIDEDEEDLTGRFGVDAVPALVVVGLEDTGGSRGTSSSSGHLSEDAKVIDTFIGKECVQNFKSKSMIADKNTDY